MTSALRSAESAYARADVRRRGCGQRGARAGFGDDREREHDDRRAPAQGTEPRMQHEEEPQEHRHPRRIEEGADALRADEAAQLGEFAQKRRAAAAPAHARPDDVVEDGRGDVLLHPVADATEQNAADPVERAVNAERNAGDQRQHQQRLGVPGPEHAVVDLQHVKRKREDEEIRQQTQQRRADERPATVSQGDAQRRRLFDTPSQAALGSRHPAPPGLRKRAATSGSSDRPSRRRAPIRARSIVPSARGRPAVAGRSTRPGVGRRPVSRRAVTGASAPFAKAPCARHGEGTIRHGQTGPGQSPDPSSTAAVTTPPR